MDASTIVAAVATFLVALSGGIAFVEFRSDLTEIQTKLITKKGVSNSEALSKAKQRVSRASSGGISSAGFWPPLRRPSRSTLPWLIATTGRAMYTQ